MKEKSGQLNQFLQVNEIINLVKVLREKRKTQIHQIIKLFTAYYLYLWAKSYQKLRDTK